MGPAFNSRLVHFYILVFVASRSPRLLSITQKRFSLRRVFLTQPLNQCGGIVIELLDIDDVVFRSNPLLSRYKLLDSIYELKLPSDILIGITGTSY